MEGSSKRYLAKILERNGSDIALSIPNSRIRVFPVFSDRMNGGQGECVIAYNAPFDDFGEGIDMDHQYILELSCFDDENQDGRVLYTGAIQEFEPYIFGEESGVLIKALGLGSNLSYDKHMASTRTVYTVSYSGDDPQDIFKAVIDEWRAYVNNPLLNYGVGSTAPVGVNVNKDFVDKSWFDCCDETKDLCPAGWWWHVGADRIASLLPKPSTPTHRFIIGKHIEKGNFPKSVKQVVNRVRVTRSGGSISHYDDAASIALYESRFESIEDSSFDGNASDQAGQKEVDDNSVPKNKNTLIVNSEYDLESIKVGDTCCILNVDEAGLRKILGVA